MQEQEQAPVKQSRPDQAPFPVGQGYQAKPIPRTKPPTKHEGMVIRWKGMSHKLKIVCKTAQRTIGEEEAELPAPIAFKKVRASRALRGRRISEHNAKCTALEKKAKDGKLQKEGLLAIVSGDKHEPFTLKLGRISNEGYSGAELRAIRAEKGCGRPPHALA